MPDLKLKLACWIYDRSRALMDGTVKPEGIELAFESARQVGQIMQRMVRERAFDVAELGFTYYLRSLELLDAPFIAIPVFPNRIFRHAAIFVNRARVQSPKDLVGRRVGELHRYGHDAGIWSKGILHDEYGIDCTRLPHFVGSLDRPDATPDWAPFEAPAGVEIHHVGANGTLEAMLEAGEIDALFSAWEPVSVGKSDSRIARLFPDYEAVERDYFARTQIFPIMHTVVIRRDLYEKNRWIARSLMQAFEDAKAQAMVVYRNARTFMGAPFMVPWLPALLDENRALMGDDPWPYGLEANRTTLEAFLRYHAEQGLSKRRWTAEELFAPECLA